MPEPESLTGGWAGSSSVLIGLLSHILSGSGPGGGYIDFTSAHATSMYGVPVSVCASLTRWRQSQRQGRLISPRPKRAKVRPRRLFASATARASSVEAARTRKVVGKKPVALLSSKTRGTAQIVYPAKIEMMAISATSQWWRATSLERGRVRLQRRVYRRRGHLVEIEAGTEARGIEASSF